MSDDQIRGIIDDLERGYDGDAWHGPPLRKVLEGVTAEMAAARPVPPGHSIREIVAHLAGWNDVVIRRIEELRPIESPDDGDFPPASDTGPDAWDAALARLDASHKRLLRTVSTLDPRGSGRRSPARSIPSITCSAASHSTWLITPARLR